jgi:hypothetical protein
MSNLENDSIKYLKKSLKKFNKYEIIKNPQLINAISRKFLLGPSYLLDTNVTKVDTNQVNRVRQLLAEMIEKLLTFKQKRNSFNSGSVSGVDSGYGSGFGSGFGSGSGSGFGSGSNFSSDSSVNSNNVIYSSLLTPSLFQINMSEISKPRINDLYVINNKNENLVLLGMDTMPTIASTAYLKMLNHFKYNMIVLGSPLSNPQPKEKYLFRHLFWRYRFDRYFETLTNIVNNKIINLNRDSIIIITDMNDLSVHSGSTELLQKFNDFNKDIIISGTVYCCNIDRIKEFAKYMNYDYNYTLNEFKKEPTYSNILDKLWGYFEKDDYPGLTGWETSKKIINGIKNLSENTSNSPYRYINAGTIVGKAFALLQMFNDIKSNPTLYTESLDDEANLHQWYIENKNKNKINQLNVIIDYNQEIFAIPDEFETRKPEQNLLNGLNENNYFTFTYDLSKKRFKNKLNKYPIFIHYAGYESTGLHSMRAAFIKKLNDEMKIFNSSDNFDKQYLDFVFKCGNLQETQSNENLCKAIGCKYYNTENIKCQHDIINPKRFSSFEENFQLDWLKKNK